MIRPNEPGVFVLTGIMAAGKSTIGQLLAEYFEKSVHVRGDTFRKMVVSGRVDMTPDLPEEAINQLRLRYDLTIATVKAYWEAGFTVIVQDNIFGQEWQTFLQSIPCTPLYAIVLCPEPAVVAQREQDRDKKGYGAWTPVDLDRGLREGTPRLGLWLDSSKQTPSETMQAILHRADKEARICTPSTG